MKLNNLLYFNVGFMINRNYLVDINQVYLGMKIWVQYNNLGVLLKLSYL